MKEQNMDQIPTPETLQNWAKSGNVEHIEAVLDNLRGKEDSSEPTAERAVAVTTKIELATTFGVARQNLETLYDRRPAVVRDDADTSNDPAKPVDSETLARAAGEFEGTVSDYLDKLGPDVDAACEKHGMIEKLQAALKDPERQAATLKQLATIGEVTPDWLASQAHRTILGVKENLWEAVQTGKDSAAFAQEKSPDEITPYVEDWKQSMDDGFKLARTDLQEAADWLNGLK